MKRCYFCGGELVISAVVGRDEICPQCHRDLRCCLNCLLHDARASNQCREPQSEPVHDRDRGNFCEFFIFGDREHEAQGKQAVEKARAQWESLFKK